MMTTTTRNSRRRQKLSTERIAWLVVGVQQIFLLIFVIINNVTKKTSSWPYATNNIRYLHKDVNDESIQLRGEKRIWHGGHPVIRDRLGSCWCSYENNDGTIDSEEYCMCTPSLAIDVVIASSPNHVWLVRRKDTDQLATMGGFVNVGETAEDAVQRELEEETGIRITEEEMILLGIYSDPKRDNRRHTVSAVYIVNVSEDIIPRAADDVKDVVRVSLDDIGGEKADGATFSDFFADHLTILLDYKSWVQRQNRCTREKNGDLPLGQKIAGELEHVIRSVCA